MICCSLWLFSVDLFVYWRQWWVYVPRARVCVLMHVRACVCQYLWTKWHFHVDVNECLGAPNPCSFDCRNTEGSYECVCPKGYQVDGGRSCVGKYIVRISLIKKWKSVHCWILQLSTDVDECSTKQHNCQYLCINTVGSFKCECPHGFVQEVGKNCKVMKDSKKFSFTNNNVLFYH